MDKFSQVLNQKEKEFFPKPKKMSKFYESAMSQAKSFDVFISEQDMPPEEAPGEAMPSPEMQGSEQPTEPEPPELNDKPYNILAWVAYQALMTDPSDVSNSPFYDQLQDLTDGGDKAAINSPERGVRVFQAIEEIMKNLDTPSNSDLPVSGE